MTVAELAKPKAKTRRLWTYREMVAELPETNLPTELWDGEIVRSPTPTPSHQTIVLNLVFLFSEITLNLLKSAFG